MCPIPHAESPIPGTVTPASRGTQSCAMHQSAGPIRLRWAGVCPVYSDPMKCLPEAFRISGGTYGLPSRSLFVVGRKAALAGPNCTCVLNITIYNLIVNIYAIKLDR